MQMVTLLDDLPQSRSMYTKVGSRSQVVQIVGSTYWLPRNCQIGSGCRLSASLEGIQCDQGVVYSPANPADFFPGMPSTRLETVQPHECLAQVELQRSGIACQFRKSSATGKRLAEDLPRRKDFWTFSIPSGLVL